MLGFTKKRSVGIILILSFLLSLIIPYISVASTAVYAVPTKYDCGNSLANFQEETFDTGTTAIPRYNPVNNLEINWSLFRLFGIAAYGDLTQIPGQQFKAAYEDKGQGTVEPGVGRFIHQRQCGEWRYYGYDMNGNPYYNFYFPADQWGGNQDTNKRWIAEPWDSLPNSYSMKPDDPGNIYGSMDPFHSMFDSFGRYLRDQLGFPIDKGITLKDGAALPLTNNSIDSSTGMDADPRQFAVIALEPTLLIPGSATMFHQSSAAQSGVFYQTFQLDKITTKQKLPVTASLSHNPNPVNLTNFKGKTHAVVDIQAIAKLEDEDILEQKFNYYNREDIKSWKLEITSADGSSDVNLVDVSPNQVANQATSSFAKVEIPIAKIAPDMTYRVNLKATVTFHNGMTQSGTAPGIIQFMGGDDYFEYMTEFTINPRVTFKTKSQFEAKRIGYRNATPEDQPPFGYYEIEIFDHLDSTSAKHRVAAGAISNSTVESALHTFMASKFSYESDITIERQFWVTQKIYAQGKVVAEATPKEITVKQWGKDDDTVEYVYDPETGSELILRWEVLEYLTPDVTIPDKWYDVVGFPAVDRTEGWKYRTVRVDGVTVDADAFFRGEWVSGVGTHGLRNVYIEWTSPNGITSSVDTWTVIYDTKPRVQINMDGLYKQNRKMSATNESDTINLPFVIDRYPLTYEFTLLEGYGGDDGSLRLKTDTAHTKEFLYKEPGHYAISLTARNSLGRVSDPYIVEFEILPDEKPAVVLHAIDGQVARGDTVRIIHDVESVDGDMIEHQWVKLWYDADNNGTFETLVDTYTDVKVEEITPPAGKIGKYMLEGHAIESTNQETIPGFVTEADNKSNTFKTYFEVGNYQPMAELYLDKPIERPPVDVYFMLDKNIKQDRTDYMTANEVTNTNKLIGIQVDPQVDTWDMKTYTYSTSASTSSGFGTSFPNSTYYYCSNGYCGTLERTSYSNNPWTKDEGSYKTREVTRTESRSFSGSCTNTRYWVDGGWTGSDSDCPSSYSINSDGFVGSIPRTRTETNYYRQYDESQHTAYYEGTLTKTVTETVEYWVPNIVTYDDYTGYYSGTIYKDVRQSYDNSFMRLISNKYIVYMTDSTISELSDLQHALIRNDAKLVCVGQSSMRSKISCDKFIESTSSKTTDQLVDEVVAYIKETSPPTFRTYRLVGESFMTKAGAADIEGDPIIKDELKIWQDMSFFEIPNGFDNSEGPSPGAATSYDAAPWRAYQDTHTYHKPGLYRLIRRVQDQPSADPRFAGYNFYSAEAELEVVFHRKPIATVKLDWEYDHSYNNYKTSWIDESYDLDHEFNHPSKGIVDRVLTLRHQGTGELWFTIPDRLNHGTYDLTYAVKDVEGAWSDTFRMTFTLDRTPPIQMKAKARPELAKFSMNSIPASEQLRLYDIWTRYPYNHSLEVAIYDASGNSRRTSPLTVAYYTGTKTGNDISWRDIVYTIPETLPDGNYTLRISAIGQSNVRTNIDFPIRVHTPINLLPELASEIMTREPINIAASTTKYAQHVTVTMFRGSRNENNQLLNGTSSGDQKDWLKVYDVPAIPDGHYQVRYVATTPNGNSETKDLVVEIVNNRPPVAEFTWTPDTIWEGDHVRFINQSTDPDGDPLTFDWLVTMPDGSTYNTKQRDFTLRLMQPGQYHIRLIASDGRFSSVAEKTLVVRELTLTADVSHTNEWLEYHRGAGHEIATHPKDFYTGETFILDAVTSPAPVNAVTAELNTTGKDGETLYVVTLLREQQPTRYLGEMYDERFSSLTAGITKGNHLIRFSVQYMNGIVKTVEVPIHIIGHVLDTAGVHRRQ